MGNVKKKEFILKEYARHLSDDDLRHTSSRLGHRLSGDLPEVFNFVSQSPEVDRIFATTQTAWELYDLTDEVRDHVDREMRRRSFPVERPVDV